MVDKNIKVFFRDDDLGYYEPWLGQFLGIFVSNHTKLNLEAIPCRVFQNKYLLEVLKPYLESNLFEVHQHGQQHVEMYKKDFISEFENRDIDEVINELTVGKHILEDAFGQYFKPYFTAPWEQIPGTLIDWIKREYIEVSGRNEELKIHMDLRIKDERGCRWKETDELIKEFENIISNTDDEVIGIRLHHYLYSKVDGLIWLDEFLEYLNYKGIKSVFFSEIK